MKTEEYMAASATVRTLYEYTANSLFEFEHVSSPLKLHTNISYFECDLVFRSICIMQHTLSTVYTVCNRLAREFRVRNFSFLQAS
jgi:hypothetical protein